MKKYKQTVIPEASTEKWEISPAKELRNAVSDYYRARYQGRKRVVNQHLGIAIEFDRTSVKKTSYGGSIYPKKACLVEVLDTLIRHAKYSNWGERKVTDKPIVIGYLNFKAKVRINGALEHIRLAIRVTNNGKFHYSMEVNIWK